MYIACIAYISMYLVYIVCISAYIIYAREMYQLVSEMDMNCALTFTIKTSINELTSFNLDSGIHLSRLCV